MHLSRVERDKKIDELRERVGILENLLRTPGWMYVDQVLQGQVRAHRSNCFNMDLKSLDDCFRMTSDKGAVAGIQLALVTPESLINDAKANLNLLIEEEEEEDHA